MAFEHLGPNSKEILEKEMIRFLSIILSMGIVLAFSTVGIIKAAEVHHLHDWGVVGLVFAVALPLSWLVSLAITNREV